MDDRGKLTGANLAAVLRPRIEEISAEVIARYGRYYAHSANAGIDLVFASEWNIRELDDFLSCIAAGGTTNGNHAAWAGDAVAPHFEALSPLFNRLEMVLLYAEVCVEFLWEEYVGQSAQLNEVVAAFESCVQRLIASDAESYLAEKLVPGALENSWKLGPHTESAAVAAGRESGAATPDLSRRQLQIVRFVAEGRSNGEIASELGISANTVKNHLAAIFDKLNVNNRTELALRATRDGLLE